LQAAAQVVHEQAAQVYKVLAEVAQVGSCLILLSH
jgi:hypothetical protein